MPHSPERCPKGRRAGSSRDTRLLPRPRSPHRVPGPAHSCIFGIKGFVVTAVSSSLRSAETCHFLKCVLSGEEHLGGSWDFSHRVPGPSCRPASALRDPSLPGNLPSEEQHLETLIVETVVHSSSLHTRH